MEGGRFYDNGDDVDSSSSDEDMTVAAAGQKAMAKAKAKAATGNAVAGAVLAPLSGQPWDSE